MKDSDAIVEPYLIKTMVCKNATSWLITVLENQKNKDTKVNFVPERYEKIMTSLDGNYLMIGVFHVNLWWGHQIPAWYHKDDGEVYVGVEAPKEDRRLDTR